MHKEHCITSVNQDYHKMWSLIRMQRHLKSSITIKRCFNNWNRETYQENYAWKTKHNIFEKALQKTVKEKGKKNLRNVSGSWRRPIFIEKSHEVPKLPVQITKYFHRSLDLQYTWLTCKNTLRAITEICNFIAIQEKLPADRRLPTTRLQKMCNDLE